MNEKTKATKAAILCVNIFFLAGCVSDAGVLNGNEKEEVVSAGYQALRLGDASLLDDYLMNGERYFELDDIQMEIQEKGMDAVQVEVQKASEEAKNAPLETLKMIRDALKDLQFDWSEAELASILVPERGSQGTEWIDYSANNPSARLDITYCIQSEGNTASIKLNDVFLVKGKRYLGRGYHFSSFLPNELASEEIKRLIIGHNLNSYLDGCFDR